MFKLILKFLFEFENILKKFWKKNIIFVIYEISREFY